MGEAAEAVTHLTKALQLSPESEPTKYMLALAYKKMNQIKNSAELFSQLFPTEDSLAKYRHKVDELNRQIYDQTSITGDDSSIYVNVDFYSHLRELKVCSDQ